MDEVRDRNPNDLAPSSAHATEPLVTEVADGIGKRRIANLHRGEPLPTPDFDDPLPDDFWLGDDERSLT